MNTVKNIMTRKDDIILASPDTEITEVAKILIENQINGAPIVEKGKLVGIIGQSDLVAQQKQVSVPSYFSILGGFIPLSLPKKFEQEVQKMAAMTIDAAMTHDPVTVKPDTTIEEVPALTNSHLHQCEIADTRHTDPRFMVDAFDDFSAIDYSGIRVIDLVSEHGAKLRMGYEYDFGDGWQHEVDLEGVIESETGIRYPRCIDDERACPPEDIGDVYGFVDYVEAITNPNHSEHDDFLEWNGPFDPAEFDATRATRRMKKGLPAW